MVWRVFEGAKLIKYCRFDITNLIQVTRCTYFFPQPISFSILFTILVTLSKCIIHVGISLFIQPITRIISLCISIIFAKFQQIGSWWNTLFLKVLNLLSGAEIFFRCLIALGILGKASRKSFQRIFSYSLFKSVTQKPRVNSATIFEGDENSFRPEICLLACEMYLCKFVSPGVFWKCEYQSSRPLARFCKPWHLIYLANIYLHVQWL